MMLTDAKIKAVKLDAGKKIQKLSDGKGLYLQLMESGKYWRLKYRFTGKEKTLAIGVYPQVSLKQAREACMQAKELLLQGLDPSHEKKRRKLQVMHNGVLTFEVAAREWHAEHSKTVSASYSAKVIRSLELDVFPWLGLEPIHNIKAKSVLNTLKRVAERGAEETARRLKTTCSQIFCYAILHHDLEYDPTQSIKGFLKGKKDKHYPCITEPKDVGGLLRAIDEFQGTFIVQSALKLSPYLFLRPGELRTLEWSFVDFEERQIVIPASNMKMKEKHIVPLSEQAISILKAIQPLTGARKYVFPSMRSTLRPMSNNTVNAALRRAGISKEEHCAHGFRGTASTLLHEKGINSDFIERQLAHKEGNAIKSAYNHARHLKERKEMMQFYADYLDSLRKGAAIILLRAK